MRKEASGKKKEMAPKAAKPAVLSAEAAAMEQKLVELRKAMEKERAKREAVMANTGGGPIWRNGAANGGLRTGVKGKGPDDASAPSAPASSTPSASHRPGSGEATVVQSAAAPGSIAPRASSARGARTSPDSEMPSVSGSRLAANRAEDAPGASGSKGSAGAGVKGGSAVGGMSCGTDDTDLAGGAFSEADSHQSFLDALNEWRRGSRGDTAPDSAAQATTSTTIGSGRDRAPQRPRSATQSASLEVQTDARPASQPSSSKPLSYFDKLVINSSSRAAGHLADRGRPESLRGSLAGQAAGLPRVLSATRPPIPPPLSALTKPSTAGPTTTSTASSPPEGSKSIGTKMNASREEPVNPLSILDRLEALERQRQSASQSPDDEDNEVAATIRVTTATGVMLTKGVRLPDEVLLPPNEGC